MRLPRRRTIFVCTEAPSHLDRARRRRYERVRSQLADLAGGPCSLVHYSDVNELDHATAIVLSGSDAPWEAHPADAFAGLRRALATASTPVLGICAGMQMLACVMGCRMSPDIGAERPGALEHDRRGHFHAVSVVPGTRLSAMVAQPCFAVNSLHREAVVELAEGVVAGAHAEDGVIEAVEIRLHERALDLEALGTRRLGDRGPGVPVVRIGEAPADREQSVEVPDHRIHDLREIRDAERQAARVPDRPETVLRRLVARRAAARVLVEKDGDAGLRHAHARRTRVRRPQPPMALFTVSASCFRLKGLGRKPKLSSSPRFLRNASSA